MLLAMIKFFEYQFVQNAFIASVLLSILIGLVGSYIVARRLVFLSGGITHASFGGVGIAWYLGLNPIAGAAVFAVLTALGLEVLTQNKKLREDSAIGMLWSFGMAIGIFFVFLTPGYAPNLMSYLFGDILTISSTDVWLLVALSIITLIFYAVFYHAILFYAFDPNYAKTQHLPVVFINIILKIIIALVIVFSIRAVGIILLISLLTIPANVANLFTNKFTKIISFSFLVSIISLIAGIIFSYWFNVPTGATVVLTLIILYLIARLIISIRNSTRLTKA